MKITRNGKTYTITEDSVVELDLHYLDYIFELGWTWDGEHFVKGKQQLMFSKDNLHFFTDAFEKEERDDLRWRYVDLGKAHISFFMPCTEEGKDYFGYQDRETRIHPDFIANIYSVVERPVPQYEFEAGQSYNTRRLTLQTDGDIIASCGDIVMSKHQTKDLYKELKKIFK